MLPDEFTSYTSQLFGATLWQRYLTSFSEQPPVSIRLNPFKPCSTDHLPIGDAVPWCDNAFYLTERPAFTLDPLLHAGAYYVQEASSMFLHQAVSQWCDEALWQGGLLALDLCAAPGGKSTLLRSLLPPDVTLFSNEPDRRRANILMENMQKQGHPRVIVTNAYPRDYARTPLMFPFILADVPCSGEGMFRKDATAIDEWSPQNVIRCQQLQRTIIEEIWPHLLPGGILVYSTCTFNTRENEENVRWICESLGGQPLPIQTDDTWGITGSLLSDYQQPVYRFIPGVTRGEGLFMAVIRKNADALPHMPHVTTVSDHSFNKTISRLHILSDGHPQPTVKGKTVIPPHAAALLTFQQPAYPLCELNIDTALSYLRHEAIKLPDDAPRGYVIVTYQGLPLGFVKNIGTRANNLYPQEWKIRN